MREDGREEKKGRKERRREAGMNPQHRALESKNTRRSRYLEVGVQVAQLCDSLLKPVHLHGDPEVLCSHEEAVRLPLTW